MKLLFTNVVMFLFITMFSYAAISKWLDFNLFISQMNKQPFDDRYTPLLVWVIPIAEMLVSLMMVIPATSQWGLRIATGMMIIFTGYIVLIELNYYDKVPCSCGGAITELSWDQHLIFNLFFVIAGSCAIIIQRKKHIYRDR